MDKKELEIVEEMQLVVEQMRLDDIEENPNIVEDFFECDCCSKHKCLAGSVQYKQYRLCNDCVLLAETGFALNRIKEIEDLMQAMEDTRLKELCDYIKNDEKAHQN